MCVELPVGWDGGNSGEDKAEQTSRDQITEPHIELDMTQ